MITGVIQYKRIFVSDSVPKLRSLNNSVTRALHGHSLNPHPVFIPSSPLSCSHSRTHCGVGVEPELTTRLRLYYRVSNRRGSVSTTRKHKGVTSQWPTPNPPYPSRLLLNGSTRSRGPFRGHESPLNRRPVCPRPDLRVPTIFRSLPQTRPVVVPDDKKKLGS